jgi:hypothetical protein
LAIGSTGWSEADKVVRNGKDQSHAALDPDKTDVASIQSGVSNLAREMLTQS